MKRISSGRIELNRNPDATSKGHGVSDEFYKTREDRREAG